MCLKQKILFMYMMDILKCLYILHTKEQIKKIMIYSLVKHQNPLPLIGQGIFLFGIEVNAEKTLANTHKA